MNFIAVLLATICFFTNWQLHSGGGVTALTAEQILQIDSLVGVYRNQNYVPGLGLAIVENNGNGAVAFAKGYGQSRIESNTSATSQTLFAIASVTKSFTSTLVVKVLSEKFPELGESVLDKPITELAPGFNFTLSDRYRSEYISFRDLLSHRSCLFNYGFDILFGMNTPQQFDYRTRYETGICPFRAGGVYNNNLYALAGSLIAHIAGTSFTELMNSFFDDLGMTNSMLGDGNGSHEELPNMSHAYFRKDNETQQYNTTHLRRLGVVAGAGAILSNPNDMAQYLKFHLGKGKIDDNQIVPEEALGWMYKVASAIPSAVPIGLNGQYGYGLGLGLSIYKGNAYLSHGGYWPPYESALGLFPDQGLGIYLTTNGPGASGTYPGQMTSVELLLSIFDIIQANSTAMAKSETLIKKTFPYTDIDNLGRIQKPRMIFGTPSQLSINEPPEQMNKKKIQYAEPEDIVGNYGSPSDGDISITLGSNQVPFIYFGNWAYGNLIRKNDTTYTIEWTSRIMDDFYSYGNVGMPIFEVDFSILNQFTFVSTDISVIFIKDRLIDTIPVIPWDPNSCGPANGDKLHHQEL